MRAFVMTTFALAVALVPAAASAQATTTPPAQAAPAPAPAQPEPPALKVPFTTPAGMLLVSIKPDKTAVFEEMYGKLKAGFARSTDETLKKQAAGFKVFKSSDPFNGNVLYVVVLDPSVPASEYDLFQMLAKTMSPEEQRAPETADMWKKYSEVFAAPMSKINLTPLGGV